MAVNGEELHMALVERDSGPMTEVTSTFAHIVADPTDWHRQGTVGHLDPSGAAAEQGTSTSLALGRHAPPRAAYDGDNPVTDIHLGSVAW